MTLHITLAGKCSTFGGPDDSGVGPQDGLALIEKADLADPYWAELFLLKINGDFGLARNLNPNAFYCAMRWDEVFACSADQARELARGAMVRITLGNESVWMKPADYGPGDGRTIDNQATLDTRRIIDLSPGGAKRLRADTDAVVTVEVFA